MKEHRKRRRLLINDGTSIMSGIRLPATMEYLRKRMAAVYGGTPVDALQWIVGDREVYHYETRVGELFGEGYEDFNDFKNTYPYSPSPDSVHRAAAKLRHLIDKFGGPLTLMVQLCHEAGMDIFASMRMNSHYNIDVTSPAYGRFRREHPELLIGRPGEVFPEDSVMYGIKGGVDYSHAQVRDHYAAVITELFERFDVDGVDLDFMRHPAVFRPEEAYANRHLMTDMLRQVRERMKEVSAAKGRSVELSVRAESFADSARIGLDVAEWMAQDLVDVVIAGSGWIPFEMPIREFVEAAQGTDIQVFGSIEGLRPAMDDDVVRAAASRFWNAGASGVHLYNFGPPQVFARHCILDQIVDAEAMRRQDKRYQMDRRDRHHLPSASYHTYAFHYATPHVQLPVTLSQTVSGRVAVLRLVIDEDLRPTGDGQESDGQRTHTYLRLALENYDVDDEAEVRLNGELLPMDSARQARVGWDRLEWRGFPATKRSTENHSRPIMGSGIEFDVGSPPLKQGENEVEVRLVKHTAEQTDHVVIRYAEVAVKYG